MLYSNLDVGCHETIARHLPDEDIRTLTQVCKSFHRIFSDDRFYTPPANDLRDAWATATREIQGQSNGLRLYQKRQSFHRFVRQQPPPINILKVSRAEDPALYSRLEGHFAFADTPDFMLDLVRAYPREIPVLSLGDRKGHTRYIDFLKPSDLSAPVMRGVDGYGRPFLSIKATFELASGRQDTVVQTLFKRNSDPDSELWTTGNSEAPLFFSDCNILNNNAKWRGQVKSLLSTGEARFRTNRNEHRMVLG